MIAKVGDIIAYTDVYDGSTYEWLGKVKSLEKDGVVVEQRGYFEKTENVAGRTVKLPQEVRNVRVSRFKRVSPKDVKQYERQGWKFSHAYGGNGGNGGNGGGNGSSANRSLLRSLEEGKFITFIYRGKPVYGQIDKIDRRTGEVHMKTNPQGMYNQNLLGIPIPTPGSTAEIKFRPSANSQITSLGRGTPSKNYKIALKKKGFQNLSVGFKLSNNSNDAMSMNFLVEKLLGEKAQKFRDWSTALQVISGMKEGNDRDNAIMKFLVDNLGELENLDALLRSTKPSTAVKQAITDMKAKLLGQIKKLYGKNDTAYEAMMKKAQEIVEVEKARSWGPWLASVLARAGGLVVHGAKKGTEFFWGPSQQTP